MDVSKKCFLKKLQQQFNNTLIFNYLLEISFLI